MWSLSYVGSSFASLELILKLWNKKTDEPKFKQHKSLTKPVTCFADYR